MNCNPVLELYSENHLLLSTVNDYREGESEYLEWRSSTDGIYYVRIRNYNPDVFGENTEYLVMITKPYMNIGGIVYGTIEPNIHAVITTGNESALTLSNGSYFMPHKIGEFTIAVNANGFKPFTKNVVIKDSTPVKVDITLINNSGG